MLGRQLAAFGFGNEPAFGDTDQRVMRFEIFAPRVERLVRASDRDPVAVSEIEQRRLDLLFFGASVTLQLDIEPVAERREKPRATRRRKLRLPGAEREIERPAGTAGQGDQPCCRDFQRVKFDVRRLVGRRVEERARGEPHQVAVAFFVCGEQHETRQLQRMAWMARCLLVAEIDGERAADDRLDAGARELVRELKRAKHVVGVGQRERRLTVGFGELGELADGQRAFQQRIGRVHMQMHKTGIGHVSSSRISFQTVRVLAS
jgi:hypothetical protein